MTDAPLLVVGCGSIGQRHLRNLKGLGATRLLCVDPVVERLAEAARLGAEPHDSLGSALARRPAAVLICTPPTDHLSPARAALAAGAHLFIEKPIAAELAGVEELLAEARRLGLLVAVGYNLRSDAGLRHAKELLDRGAIGRPLVIRAEFGSYLPEWRPGRDYRTTYTAQQSQGGGILLDGSHEIDYVRWLAGEVRAVSAVTDKLGDLEIDVEDTAALVLRHDGGTLSEVHLDLLQRSYSRGCKVIGTDGVIEWEMGRGVSLSRPPLPSETFAHADEIDVMYRDEMCRFLDAISGGPPPLVTGEDGRRVLEIVIAAKRSSATARVVEV